MCTALCVKTTDNKYFFGRNMDLGYNFNQSVLFIPDSFCQNNLEAKHSVIGIGTIIDNHSMLADGMNDRGLACAGLNFAGNAFYEKKPADGKINIAPYDFIPWTLFNFSDIQEVLSEIKNIELVDIPINKQTPVPTLHWMLSDKTGACIVVEKTKNGLKIHENPVYVMTNDPEFTWHLTNLNEYLYLKPFPLKITSWCNKELKPIGIGSGTLGMPGDFSSASRFVRIAYLRANFPEAKASDEAITSFFHTLDCVKMPKGAVINSENQEAFTIYSSCMDLDEGIYYYKTYENNRINAVDMRKEASKTKEIKAYPCSVKQDYNYVN